MIELRRFEKAVQYVRNVGIPEDSHHPLNFYKYYQQALYGDCSGTRPYSVQMAAAAKWDAWNSVRGMSTEDAETHYVALLDATVPNWESTWDSMWAPARE